MSTPLVITSTSIALSPLRLGRMLRFVHMCMTSRTLNRKQNQQIDAVISDRYVCLAHRHSWFRSAPMIARVCVMVVSMLNATVVSTRPTDTSVADTLYSAGHRRSIDHACTNSAARMSMVTGMLSTVTVALRLKADGST